MDKPAPVDHPVNELIQARWSPRAFADQNVPTLELCSLFEAARWSASCFNEQPWRFIVGTKSQGEVYDKILSTLVDFNQQWASTAPVLMLSVATSKFTKNGKPNRHGAYDLGQAVAQLATEATARGLFLHQMAGFDEDKARELFEIPEDCEVMAAIALGYPGELDRLPEEIAKGESAPRERRKLSEFVFGSRFGEEASLVD